MRTIEDLKQLQALPLHLKIKLTQSRIRQWVNEFGTDGVYISFSGGKDSTVLLHIVRELYPEIPAVFCDTGLEYPEIRDFVRTFDNVEWLKPSMTFREVIETYGYPFISKEISQKIFDVKTNARHKNIHYTETYLYHRNFTKESDYAKKYPSFARDNYAFFFEAPFDISHRCCDIMKKKPSKHYEKKTGRRAILGTMAAESRLRATSWVRHGCNSFDAKRQTSSPMAFWVEQDVLHYIIENNLPLCSVYGEIIESANNPGQLETTGCSRTGCMFCGFGCHLDKEGEGRFEVMKETHPAQYEWIMKPWDEGGLGYKEVIDWINENGNLHIRY